MGIEERQFLLAVHGIVRAVDVEHDVSGRCPEATAIEIDVAEPDPCKCPPIGGVIVLREIAARLGFSETMASLFASMRCAPIPT